MANNPYVNKVEYGNRTIMDLTNDTVDDSKVLLGETFHDRSGAPQTGSLVISDIKTQELIAPVQDTLIAKQNYEVGQQFILGGALFTVIKSGGISEGDTINMNTDVEASDKITDQINNVMDEIVNFVNSKLTLGQQISRISFLFVSGNRFRIQPIYTEAFLNTHAEHIHYVEFWSNAILIANAIWNSSTQTWNFITKEFT